MSVLVNQTAPDFEADTTHGRIRFHDWVGDSWAVLFSHPKDFTPVRTTELGYMAKLQPEFEKRNMASSQFRLDLTTDQRTELERRARSYTAPFARSNGRSWC
jgi:alkyl hydroperoxide reductase subunit AhpC